MQSRLALLTILACGLCSCAFQNQNGVLRSVSENYCEPTLTYAYNTAYQPRSVLPTDTSLTNHYAPHDLLMANATGIVPLLEQLSQLRQSDSAAFRLEKTICMQRIQSRLLLASTEIASLAAELDCEGERADQLARFLDQKDQGRVRNLTLMSVILGAATTVATAFIQDNNVGKAVSIGGGMLSAGLGGAAVFSSKRVVPFMHKRNLLTDIWKQSAQSTQYPPFIWYVLNEKRFSNSGQMSIRANIRQRWQNVVVSGISAEAQQLYFGTGGEYQADDLHARSNMLNQLQASVRSINQDLQSLQAQFIR